MSDIVKKPRLHFEEAALPHHQLLQLCVDWNLLPNDVWLVIFDLLIEKNRFKIERTCRKWQALLQLKWRSVSKLHLNRNFLISCVYGRAQSIPQADFSMFRTNYPCVDSRHVEMSFNVVKAACSRIKGALKEVYVHRYFMFRSDMLDVLASCCSNLELLSFYSGSVILVPSTDYPATPFEPLARCTKLSTLKFDQPSFGRTVLSTPESCFSLVSSCQEFTHDFGDVANLCSSLTHIDIQTAFLSEQAMRSICANLSKVQALCIKDSRCTFTTRALMNFIGSIPSTTLKHLNFGGYRSWVQRSLAARVTDKVVQLIVERFGCTLETLSLRTAKIGPASLSYIANCRELTHLNLVKCSEITNSAIEILYESRSSRLSEMNDCNDALVPLKLFVYGSGVKFDELSVERLTTVSIVIIPDLSESQGVFWGQRDWSSGVGVDNVDETLLELFVGVDENEQIEGPIDSSSDSDSSG